jgi:membrane protein DedA with SNARE-associated domain|tara:strand:- start:1799 stop:2011 length:213 start_codon:yes stop_codon:yes gene_type:complete
MKTKNQNRSFSILQISGAIIWAAVILICSMLLKDSDKNQMVINVLIIGAASQILLIGSFANKLLKKKNIA